MRGRHTTHTHSFSVQGKEEEEEEEEEREEVPKSGARVTDELTANSSEMP